MHPFVNLHAMTLQGAGKEKKENEVKVAVVEVILQAENVLQPSVLVQAYNLLQVGVSFSQDQSNYEPALTGGEESDS